MQRCWEMRLLTSPATACCVISGGEVGHVSLELWDDVASVLGLYQPTFIADGWQNEPEYQYADETTANRYRTFLTIQVDPVIAPCGLLAVPAHYRRAEPQQDLVLAVEVGFSCGCSGRGLWTQWPLPSAV